MKRLILIIFLLPLFLISEEIEIPDELTPYKNNSEILFSYEFDEKPEFIEQISDKEYLILVIDDDEAYLYTYNSVSNKVEIKLEFIVVEDETLDEYKIIDNRLELFFRSYYYQYENPQGDYSIYLRQTILDIESFSIVDSKIIYTTEIKEDFDNEKINEDLEYSNESFNEGMLIEEEYLEELEIELEDNSRLYKVYNENDSTKFVIFNQIFDDDLEKDYLRYTFFDPNIKSPKNKIILLKDSTNELYYKNIVYTYLDDNSNLFFLYHWLDYENEKRFLSLCKLSPKDEIITSHFELDYQLFDEEYWVNKFYETSKENDIIHTLGFASSRENGSIVSLYKAEIDLKKVVFNLKQKKISEEEGEKINSGKEIFSIGRIFDIIEKNNEFIVFGERSKLNLKKTKRDFSTSYLYTYIFQNINIFKVDENLNIIWNNYIERDIDYFGNFLGNKISAEDLSPIQLLPKGQLKDNIYTFTYTTSEPDDYVMRVSYDIKTGKKTSETILFENDGMPSFMPGSQIELGNNEYVTILNFNDFYSENYYLIRYKLNK